jgi:hypothetical protein
MFHLSLNDLGTTKLFSPRIPEADIDEAHLPPRICAAPTVEQCLMGISGGDLDYALEYLAGRQLFVYETVSDKYVDAVDVPDFFRTSEVFYTSDTMFKLVATCVIVDNKIVIENPLDNQK